MEQSTKMLGGIAYIVMIVFSIFGIFLGPFSIIALAAAICVMVAFIQAGDQVGQPSVKNSIITAVVLYIIATVLALLVAGAALTAVLASGGSAGAGAAAVGAGAIIGGLVSWILFIVAAWFWYKASRSLAEGTDQSLFKVGGLLFFIGSFLIILFGLGYILMLVGEIMQCIAFFTVQEKSSAPAGNAA